MDISRLTIWILLLRMKVCLFTSALEDRGCNKPADIIFVLDASSSIWGPDFRKKLEFVKSVIRDLHIDPEMVRCGLLTYGNEVRVEFGLSAYSSFETASKAVSLVTQLRGNTRTDLALQGMMKMVEEEGRPGVPKMGVVITDGQSDFPSATSQEAEKVHRAGITLFAVGIGKQLDHRELRSLVSKEEFMWLLSNPDEVDVMRKHLSRRLCGQTDEPQDDGINDLRPLEECELIPLDVTFLLDHSIALYPENLLESQRFLKASLSLLPISRDETHVSVVTYGQVPTVHFELNAYDNFHEILLAVSRIGQRNPITDIAEALRILGSDDRRFRPEAVKVVVIITSGRSRDPFDLTLNAVTLKEGRGVRIFVIGVGRGVDRKELEDVASSPFQQFVFYVDGYEKLGSITLQLMRKICEMAQNSQKLISTFISKATNASRTFAPTTRTRATTASPRTSTIPNTPPITQGDHHTSGTSSTTVPRTLPVLLNTTTSKSTQPSTVHGTTKSVWSSSSKRRTTFPNNCNFVRPADVVFALPSNLLQDDTNHALDFVYAVSDHMDLDGFNLRVGVTPRLCPPHFDGFTLDQGSESDQLNHIIQTQRINTSDPNKTTASLLRHVRHVSFSREQLEGYYGAKKIAIVIFDRDLGKPDEQVTREANMLKNDGVVVLGITVGREPEEGADLLRLTSCAQCLLHASSYDVLDSDDLIDRLERTIIDYRCVVDGEQGGEPEASR